MSGTGSGYARATNPQQAFLAALQAQAANKTPASFIIPVLQTDPVEGDPTNLWMRTDGRMRGRYHNGTAWVYIDYPLRGDITAPPAVPAAPAPPPPAPAPKTYQKTWTATWTQTYKGDGGKRTDSRGNNYLVYGRADTYNERNASLIGFDYANIATNLSGSTVKSVHLRMTNVHAYWNSGVEVYFGIHNVTSEPATWPDGSLPRRKIVHHHFGKPQTRTVAMPLEFATRIRNGTGKGIAIEAPSDNKDFYGYAAGAGSGYTPPQLIVTYVK